MEKGMKSIGGFLKVALLAAGLSVALSACAVYPYYAEPGYYSYDPGPPVYFGFYGWGGDWHYRDHWHHQRDWHRWH